MKNGLAKYLVTTNEERQFLAIARDIRKGFGLDNGQEDFLARINGYHYSERPTEFSAPSQFTLREKARQNALTTAESIERELPNRVVDWSGIGTNVLLGIIGGISTLGMMAGMRFIPEYKPTYKTQ